MTPVTHLSNDSESLQADVMRFMAIIAFCLIAILALVRNVEPADVSEAQPEPAAMPEPIPEPAVEPEPDAPEPLAMAVSEPEPIPVAAEPEPVATAPEQTSEPEPVAEPELKVALPTAPPPSPAETDSADAVPARTEEEGLILRFASDKDFLRLIARGDITVYAYQDSEVLSLDGSYRFLESPAPGQVYELLTASIPGLVLDALRRERADIRGYRWGIALPRRISSQIERHLESVESGQLVIDRYGDVHHVAAS